MSTSRQWLSHIENSIPDTVRGYTLSSYCMTLEAWRRGIDVTFINRNRRRSELFYELSYQGKSHIFTVAKGDLVTAEATNICINKSKTKQYLKEANVSVPEGKVFEENIDDSTIIAYADQLGYPLVLKPLDGTGGKGVIANIKSNDEFTEALKYVKYELNYKKLIVEEFINGGDYRIYVLNDQVIGGIQRIPANIIGDGKTDIKQLITDKLVERDQNPSLKGRPIKIDTELRNMLKNKGYTLDSIPQNGELVLLKSKNNVSAGGESIDVTEELTVEIKHIAISAVKAIPGLVHGGVDMIIDKENNYGAVIEINSRPHITAQLFPWKGQARDIPKAIIDYYFPETKSNHYNQLYYYDFQVVWESFRDGFASKMMIPRLPNEEVQGKLFVVTGKILRNNFGQWVKKTAMKLNLNGYVKHFENGRTSIVVVGREDSILEFRHELEKIGKDRFYISGIEEKTRRTPVKVGFDIVNPELDKNIEEGYYPVYLEGIKSHITERRKRKA